MSVTIGAVMKCLYFSFRLHSIRRKFSVVSGTDNVQGILVVI